MSAAFFAHTLCKYAPSEPTSQRQRNVSSVTNSLSHRLPRREAKSSLFIYFFIFKKCNGCGSFPKKPHGRRAEVFYLRIFAATLVWREERRLVVVVVVRHPSPYPTVVDFLCARKCTIKANI